MMKKKWQKRVCNRKVTIGHRENLRFEMLESRIVLDSTVVFNEIMYNPLGAEESLEWIELHNQMAVDMDLSGWSLQRGVEYEFPAGTILDGGEYLVIAASPELFAEATGIINVLGPYAGKLSNGGEKIELVNNSDRVMDQIDYNDRGLWPVGPDGSGASLAKFDPNTASPIAENWTTSAQVGGTPGKGNFINARTLRPTPTPLTVVFNEVAAATADEFWLELGNEQDQPISLENYLLVRSGDELSPFVFSNQMIEPGGLLSLSEDMLGFKATDGDRLFLYSPDQAAVLDAVVVDKVLRGRSEEYDGRWLYPEVPTPGSTNQFALNTEIVINEIMFHDRPQYATSGTLPRTEETIFLPLDAVWSFDQTGTDWGTVWRDPGFQPEDPHGDGNLQDAWSSGAGLLGAESASLPGPKNTPLTLGVTTYYFRSEFEITEDPTQISLQLHTIIDDGAVVYLNGVEVFRLGMPEGEITSSTFASRDVVDAILEGPISIASDALVSGRNVLAVELHQSDPDSDDVVFGLELLSTQRTIPGELAQPFQKSSQEWIELFNRGTTTVDLSGWSFRDGVQFDFPSDTSLPPGQFLVIANDAEAMRQEFPGINVLGDFSGSLSNSNERILLRDDNKNPADEVHYYDGGRWPAEADGGGTSLELIDPQADNSRAEAWAASDESEKSQWQTYSYRGIVRSDGSTEEYHELILGLLDSGEVLLDDIQVIEDPDGRQPRQLIQNPTFDGPRGASPLFSWRIGGNHKGQVIIDPDDSQNNVLRLTVTGALEDRLNHIETTFVNNTRIRNGQEYEISFRAKWISGSPQLNSRFYFNRLPKTTLLDIPDSAGTLGRANSKLQDNIGPTYREFRHSPTVPKARQAVTVSVVAEDPVGISQMNLFYSVGGQAFQQVAMSHQGDGLYSGTIPGQNTLSPIQFYVAGEDTLGARSFSPAAGPDSRAIYKVEDGQATKGPAHNFRLIMTEADRDLLHSPVNQMSNDRLGATVIYNEQEVFYNVGVRLKGSNAGRSNNVHLGFNIRFDPEQLFRGIHESVAIDRSGRGSLAPQTQDEILVKHVVNQAGGIASRYNDLVHFIAPNPIHNRTAMLMMARYGDEFLDSQYKNGSDGTVFKLDIAYVPNGTIDGQLESPKRPFPYHHPPSKDLANFGTDKEAYRQHLLIRNNRAADDYDRIIELSRAMSFSGESLFNTIQEIMDVDQWMRTFAVQSLTGIADTYSQGGLHHNIAFYVRPEDNKVLALPWDWDFAFTRPSSASLVGPASNLRKVITHPVNLRVFQGHLLDIINTTFNNDYMDRWVEHYGQVAGQNFSPISNYIRDRSNFVLNSLPAEIPFQMTTRQGAASTVDDLVITISGQGWINVREIRLAGSGKPLEVKWLDGERWQVTLPIAFGENEIVLDAYDYQGALIATDSITVTSTRNDRPLENFFRITEIMYNPLPPTAEEEALGFDNNDDFEFIELSNTGSEEIALAGVLFAEGIVFDFTRSAVTRLAPGEQVVVVKNLAAFANRYGAEINIAGSYSGRLSNAGEQILLVGPVGQVIQRFTYDDAEPWPTLADGEGRSLEVKQTTGQYNDPKNWNVSFQTNGTPGEPASSIADVLVASSSWNLEFFSHLEQTQGTVGGFSIAKFATTVTPLPWENIDQIKIVFREEVNIAQRSLLVEVINATFNMNDLGIIPLSFSFDADNFTATWTLDRPLQAESLLINLQQVTTMDDLPIGNFSFRFDVLPGDGNGNGMVDIRDLQKLRNSFSTSIGQPTYLAYFDFNGDGRIDMRDLQTLRSRLLST